MSHRGRKRGFTLLERTIVAAILAPIAQSAYSDRIVRSKIRAGQSDLSAVSANLENLRAQPRFRLMQPNWSGGPAFAVPFVPLHFRPAGRNDISQQRVS